MLLKMERDSRDWKTPLLRAVAAVNPKSKVFVGITRAYEAWCSV